MTSSVPRPRVDDDTTDCADDLELQDLRIAELQEGKVGRWCFLLAYRFCNPAILQSCNPSFLLSLITCPGEVPVRTPPRSCRGTPACSAGAGPASGTRSRTRNRDWPAARRQSCST